MHTHAVSTNLPVVESSFVIVNQSVKAWRALNSGQADQRLLYDGWMGKLKDRKDAIVSYTHASLFHPRLLFFTGWIAEGYICYELISYDACTTFSCSLAYTVCSG